MNPRRDEAVSAEKVRGLRSAYHAQAQPLDPGNRPGPVARPQLRIRRLGISRLRSEPKRPGGGKREGRVTAVTSPPSPASGGVTQRHVPTVAAVRGQVVPGAVASAARSRERRAGASTSRSRVRRRRSVVSRPAAGRSEKTNTKNLPTCVRAGKTPGGAGVRRAKRAAGLKNGGQAEKRIAVPKCNGVFLKMQGCRFGLSTAYRTRPADGQPLNLHVVRSSS
jgi:hypothetical protein